MTLILIGAIIAIIGGLIGAIGTWRHNKSSSEKSTRIEEGVNKGVTIGETTNTQVIFLKKQNQDLINQSNELNKKIETQSTTIDELRRENTELYSKLADASLNIYQNITGANSYCIMEIGNINATNDVGYLVFAVEGQNPLSRIQARIVDLNEPNNEPMTMTDINKNVLDIGTLDPKKAWMNGSTIRLDKINGVNLNIFFSANNGFTNQLTRMRFTKNKWTSAIRITNFEGDKEFYLKVDPDYPIQDKTKIF